MIRVWYSNGEHMKIGDLYRDSEDFGLMIVVQLLDNNAVALYHPEDNTRYVYCEEDQKFLLKIEDE